LLLQTAWQNKYRYFQWLRKFKLNSASSTYAFHIHVEMDFRLMF
jgi:hypothetical protein